MAELVDRAGIFVGETAEAFADMQYAVMRDPTRLAFAQAEMSRVMLRLIDSTRNTARQRTKTTQGEAEMGTSSNPHDAGSPSRAEIEREAANTGKSYEQVVAELRLQTAPVTPAPAVSAADKRNRRTHGKHQ